MSLYAFALVGIAATLLLVIGLASDLRSFDRTSGGYEPPYKGYTGTPTDWNTMDTTTAGMSYRGRILNVLIDCTTGMITFQWFKLEIPFREFSPRALVVHKPREACAGRGFEPRF
ncbi:MAG: hypothetical protein H7X76_09510 [Prolixibacteraceae bacterium]|nr:hypothetical protein [Burkholderiales bacterium]